ncbi:hypothetical protein AVEN_127768-1 [Araneus ventricosus]|uniref:Uncharacterized protein n=1 Tax=Araneus ventricosus TaxID=182803 RepID=A0A4Y2N7P4_ARAVE|nr:hypothetical protein AVEN_127768-1 [Araneus ventricosus]
MMKKRKNSSMPWASFTTRKKPSFALGAIYHWKKAILCPGHHLPLGKSHLLPWAPFTTGKKPSFLSLDAIYHWEKAIFCPGHHLPLGKSHLLPWRQLPLIMSLPKFILYDSIWGREPFFKPCMFCVSLLKSSHVDAMNNLFIKDV